MQNLTSCHRSNSFLAILSASLHVSKLTHGWILTHLQFADVLNAGVLHWWLCIYSVKAHTGLEIPESYWKDECLALKAIPPQSALSNEQLSNPVMETEGCWWWRLKKNDSSRYFCSQQDVLEYVFCTITRLDEPPVENWSALISIDRVSELRPKQNKTTKHIFLFSLIDSLVLLLHPCCPLLPSEKGETGQMWMLVYIFDWTETSTAWRDQNKLFGGRDAVKTGCVEL